MSYSPVQVFSVGLASNVTLSSALDLSKGYNRLALVVPTMTSATNIYLQGSDSLAGTYTRIYKMGDTSTATALTINSAVTQAVVMFPNIIAQYIKIELSTAMTAASAQFKVLISD